MYDGAEWGNELQDEASASPVLQQVADERPVYSEVLQAVSAALSSDLQLPESGAATYLLRTSQTAKVSHSDTLTEMKIPCGYPPSSGSVPPMQPSVITAVSHADFKTVVSTTNADMRLPPVRPKTSSTFNVNDRQVMSFYLDLQALLCQFTLPSVRTALLDQQVVAVDEPELTLFTLDRIRELLLPLWSGFTTARDTAAVIIIEHVRALLNSEPQLFQYHLVSFTVYRCRMGAG